jgi:hypothetical protein
MADIYVKRGAVVSAEAYDPARTDQGVTVNLDDDGNPLSTTFLNFGRVVNIRPGDMLVTDDRGTWCAAASGFAGLYQLLSEVVTPDDAAIEQTGGNQ